MDTKKKLRKFMECIGEEIEQIERELIALLEEIDTAFTPTEIAKKIELAEEPEKEEFKRQLESLTLKPRKRKDQMDEEVEQDVPLDMVLSLAVAGWYGEIKKPGSGRRRPDIQPDYDPFSQ